MNDSEWTIKRLLDWTTDYFSNHDAGQPRLDAEILLAEVMGCQRIDLYTRFDQVVNDDARSRFRDWVKRHAAGEPVAYLVGHREFFSLEFEVNSDVLIPRPETEHLVSESLDLIKQYFEGEDLVRVVDVGTGSGCIAIAIAKHCGRAKVDAVDISAEALAVARRNAERHQVDSRVHFVTSDLLENIENRASIQLVVSNPPYIGQEERAGLAVEVRDYEPETALFASDPQGLAESQRLIDQVRELSPGTFLVIESSPMNIGALKANIEDSGYQSCEVKRDLAGLERWITARLP